MAKKKPNSLKDAIKAIRKELGDGSIREGIESGGISRIKVIPTSAISLDVALGVGGIPRGKITEIYGPEGSGKSTLALHLAAEVQKSGGTVVYIDVEHAVDTKYAKSIGVDTDKLIFSQPDSGEQAFKIIYELAKTGEIDRFVVDSVAALVTQQELDGDIDNNKVMAGVARLLSTGLKRLVPIVSDHDTALVFINQIRHKIGVTFGSNETTPGGRALKYYSTIRMDIRRIAGIKGPDNDIIGNAVKCKIVKNKVAPPFKTAEFEIIFGDGINSIGSTLDLAVLHDVMERNGSNYYYNGDNLGSGKNNVIKSLKEDPALLREIDDSVKNVVLPHVIDKEEDVGKQDSDT